MKVLLFVFFSLGAFSHVSMFLRCCCGRTALVKSADEQSWKSFGSLVGGTTTGGLVKNSDLEEKSLQHHNHLVLEKNLEKSIWCVAFVLLI